MAPTAADQRSFMETAIGKFFNPDGMYDFQCKDLIDAYCVWLWGSWVDTIRPGNANQCFDNANPVYFEKIRNDPNDPNQVPQYGDIVMSAGDWLNEFGHIWLNVFATPGYMSVLQQNVGGYANTPTQGGILFYDQLGTGPVIGWLRPRLQSASIGPAGDIIVGEIVDMEDLTVADIDAIVDRVSKKVLDGMKEHMNALVITGFKWNGKDNPGLWPIVVENQKRIDALPTKIMWGETIVRYDENGKKYEVPFKQEVANIRSEQMGQSTEIDQILDQTNPELIASLVKEGQEQDVINILINALQAKAHTEEGDVAKVIIDTKPGVIVDVNKPS